MEMVSKSWLQPGAIDNHVLFVFEAPGDDECSLGRPLIGDTGLRCARLLAHLRHACLLSEKPEIRMLYEKFSEHRLSIIDVADEKLKKDSYHLTELERREYVTTLIHRLEFSSIVDNIEIVVCFGRLAWDAQDAIRNACNGDRLKKMILCQHPSGSNVKGFEGRDDNAKMLGLAWRIYDALLADEKIVDLSGFSKSFTPVQISEEQNNVTVEAKERE